MIEYVGGFGTLCLSVAMFPQVWKAYTSGGVKGISTSYLVMLVLGFVSMIVYVSLTTVLYPILVSYVLNLLMVTVLLWYKRKERKT